MDLQTENFDPSPDEELICSVCRCVFNDPVECPCRHVFCRSCITQWLYRHKSCPACRKRVSRCSLQEVVPLIKNMIMKLTLRCQNSCSGCTVKPTYEMYENHVKNCDFQVVECSNDFCDAKVLQKDFKKHELEECVFRHVICANCELSVLYSSVEEHSCVSELRKILKEREDQIATILKEKKSLIEELEKQKEMKKSIYIFSDSTLSSENDYEPFQSEVWSTSSSSESSDWSSDVSVSRNSHSHDLSCGLDGIYNDTASVIQTIPFADVSPVLPALNDTSETKSPSVLIINSTQDSIEPVSPNHADLSFGANNFSENDNYAMTDSVVSNEERLSSTTGVQTRRQAAIKRRRFSPCRLLEEVSCAVVAEKHCRNSSSEQFVNNPGRFNNTMDINMSSGCGNMNVEQRKLANNFCSVDNTSKDANINCSSSSSIASTSHCTMTSATTTRSRYSKFGKNKLKTKAAKPKRKNNLQTSKLSVKKPAENAFGLSTPPNHSNYCRNNSSLLSLFEDYPLESSDPDWEPRCSISSESETSELGSLEESPCKNENASVDQLDQTELQASESAIDSFCNSPEHSSDSNYDVPHPSFQNLPSKYVDQNSEDDSDFLPSM